MSDEARLDSIEQELKEIKQALKGYNGSGGLIPTFKEHCEKSDIKFNVLAEDYYSFKRKCFVVLGILVGSGVLGIGSWGIWELLRS